MKNVDGEKPIWKLTLAYDGTDFCGWQIQPGNPTIQGALADALAAVTGERILPQGSGRTDAGVHAEGQVASFELAAPIPPENLQRALNRILPASIRVLAAEHARADFHARHSALAKTYCYRIFAGTVCPPFLGRYVTPCARPFDLAAMQEAAEQVLGEYDFTSFAASDPDRTARLAATNLAATPALEKAGNVRRIELSQWSQEAIPSSGPFSCFAPDSRLWTYTVRGNGFLHHMVRNLVGTFLEVGQGRILPGDIASILEGRSRSLAGPTAPARGLCLVGVQYGAEEHANAFADSL